LGAGERVGLIRIFIIKVMLEKNLLIIFLKRIIKRGRY